MRPGTQRISPFPREIALNTQRRLILGAQLGRGSTATVYRGVLESDFGVERTVAVKVFDLVATEEHDSALGTLARALRDAACVRHPNVVDVYDFGLLGPAQPFAVMELVEGQTLAGLLAAYARRNQRVPLDLGLFIGIEVAEGLSGAREARASDGVPLGLSHGELGPTDVLLSWYGMTKVSDFGVGVAARSGTSIRNVWAMTQKIRSLAPEVARGQMGDARSDVFSLGIILREMLVGPRFPANVSEADALAQARDGIVHSHVFERQLSPELYAILHRALERDPAARFPHAGALAYELRRIALAMGVGDGRAFLRHALAKAFAAEGNDDEVTRRFPMGGAGPTPPPASQLHRRSEDRAGREEEEAIDDVDQLLRDSDRAPR
jgi:serine/threonine-protein kinase